MVVSGLVSGVVPVSGVVEEEGLFIVIVGRSRSCFGFHNIGIIGIIISSGSFSLVSGFNGTPWPSNTRTGFMLSLMSKRQNVRTYFATAKTGILGSMNCSSNDSLWFNAAPIQGDTSTLAITDLSIKK